MGDDFRSALQAIAEGYAVEGIDDRYIAVVNPDFEEDNGKSPRLVIDTFDLPPASPSPESDAPLPLSHVEAAVALAEKSEWKQAETEVILQAANAELRAQRDKVDDAYLRVAEALGCAATAYEPLERIANLIRERDEARAERDNWKAARDHVNRAFEQAQTRLNSRETQVGPLKAEVARLTAAPEEMREACARTIEIEASYLADRNSIWLFAHNMAAACRALPLPAAAEEEKP